MMAAFPPEAPQHSQFVTEDGSVVQRFSAVDGASGWFTGVAANGETWQALLTRTALYSAVVTRGPLAYEKHRTNASIKIGVHEDLSASALVAKYPGNALAREFVSGVVPLNTDLRVKVAAVAQQYWTLGGVAPVVSFKTDPAEVAAGRWDARLTELGQYLAGKPETWIAWYHEPEDNMTGPVFSAAFARVRSKIHAGGPNVKVGYAAMAYQWRPGSSRTATPSQWRVAADFYGCDTYSGNIEPATDRVPDSASTARWYQQLVLQTPGASSRWGLTERGFKSGSDAARAATLARESAWLQSLPTGGWTTPPTFYIYWNTLGTENNPALLDGPLATAALQKMIQENL